MSVLADTLSRALFRADESWSMSKSSMSPAMISIDHDTLAKQVSDDRYRWLMAPFPGKGRCVQSSEGVSETLKKTVFNDITIEWGF